MKIQDVEEDLDDLTGCLFGEARVLRRAPDHLLSGSRKWRCECERCGLTFEAWEHALIMGYTKNCGCGSQVKHHPIRHTRIDYEGEPVTA